MFEKKKKSRRWPDDVRARSRGERVAGVEFGHLQFKLKVGWCLVHINGCWAAWAEKWGTVVPCKVH